MFWAFGSLIIKSCGIGLLSSSEVGEVVILDRKWVVNCDREVIGLLHKYDLFVMEI